MKDRQEILSWRRELLIARARLAGATEAQTEASVPLPKLSLHALDVSFDALPDPKEMAYLVNPPRGSCCRPKTSTGCAGLPGDCGANRRTSSRCCAILDASVK